MARLRLLNSERAVLNWIRDSVDSPELHDQLDTIEVIDREHTVVGCFTNFATTSGEVVPADVLNGRTLPGPHIESELMEYGALSILWFEDGIVDCLEVVAYGDAHFPVGEFTFTLTSGGE